MPAIQITLATIVAAKARAKPGAPQSEITDTRAEGLRLRIGARGVIWQYRFKAGGESKRLNMGSVDSWDIAEARRLAGLAKDLLLSGRVPDDRWLDAQRVAFGKVEGPAPIAEPTLWVWEIARSEYLAEVERVNKPATLIDYRNMLNTPELTRFAGQAVAGIKLEDMATAVEDVHRRGVERHAEHLASVVRPMWTFLGSPTKRTLSGVRPGVMKELAAPKRSAQKDGTAKRKPKYVPPMLEVGRIVAICRSGAVHPVIAGAIELTVLAAQRVTPVAMALRSGFNEHPEYDCLWSIPSPHRKTAQRRGDEADHVLPLPSAAFDAAMRAVTWAAASDDTRLQHSLRVFPQLRARSKKNPPTTSSHLAQSTIGHTMTYMPGVKATPHDLRRALGTHGQVDLGMTAADTKIILDHLEGEKSGDVTSVSYALHHKLAHKWRLLEPWAAHVETYVMKAIEADPRLSDVKWLKRQMQIAQDIAKNMKPRHPTLKAGGAKALPSS